MKIAFNSWTEFQEICKLNFPSSGATYRLLLSGPFFSWNFLELIERKLIHDSYLVNLS